MLLFERVVIIGVGLLGGSIGLALRERKLAEQVVGLGRHPHSLDQALELGAITEGHHDVATAIAGADLVIVCTPVQSIADYVQQCLRLMRPDGLVTDVGSTKLKICEQLPAAGHARFCGSHPLAGSDKSGAGHAVADLFVDKLCVITPVAATPPPLTERTEQLWQALGCRTKRMTPADHDQAVARTSHLPHVVAAALAGATEERLLPLAASGWCDTTRVAAGSVDLWRQIVAENRLPVLDALRQFASHLQDWIEALEDRDDERLTQLLELGKQKRDSVGN